LAVSRDVPLCPDPTCSSLCPPVDRESLLRYHYAIDRYPFPGIDGKNEPLKGTLRRRKEDVFLLMSGEDCRLPACLDLLNDSKSGGKV
jgi:hypothetical protein